MNTFEKLCDICSEHLPSYSSALSEDTTFDEIGADSLDVVEILMAVESEFDIEIPESSSENIRTLGELSDYIDSLL